jgi:hypothetical protein
MVKGVKLNNKQTLDNREDKVPHLKTLVLGFSFKSKSKVKVRGRC